MAYHLLINSKEFGDTLNLLNAGHLPSPNLACFSGFFSNYNEIVNGNVPYTCLILDKEVYKSIRDFNKLFSNIKVIVKFKKELSKFTAKFYAGCEFCGKNTDDDYCILDLRFSEKYTRESVYFMYVPLIQLFRMFSPYTRYIPLNYMVKSTDKTIAGILDGHAKSGLLKAYGSWCGKEVSLESFMLLDNPEKMNKINSGVRDVDYYGTDLFIRIEKGGSDE